MTDGLDRLALAARTEAIPGGAIRDGGLNIERLAADPPDGADELILDLYKRVPDTRITDIMMDVDAATGFTDAFPHLRTGVPCTDRIGLLNGKRPGNGVIDRRGEGLLGAEVRSGRRG